ncbi:MAG: EAL domain-containing protein [Clostridium perfringens]|nr:EAL domain-containing protein [Clostridium perfringens]
MKLKIFLRKNQKNILNDLNKGNFILYYQPIVDPKKNLIVGFEALLRLKRNGQILTPYYFLKDIEKSNMMSEVSLLSFNKVISDYKVISNYSNLKNKKMYISFNLSFKEIEDSNFLNKLIEISVNNNMTNNSICLEIIEKFSLEDIDKIKKSLEILRLHGFLIAIDDFGVEYSNLDLLDKIDYDIIKLDKYFIDNINSKTNKKIIDFLSQICKVYNKTIVFEGIEEKYQFDIIKSFSYEKTYIQGYYFSKPLDIEM